MIAHRVNLRMKESPARMQAFDRRTAAIHEAGHALMALYLGYDANACIRPANTFKPLDEKTWIGHMTIHRKPVEPNHPHTRMVAVAGLVAETLWRHGHDEEYAVPDGWEDYLRDEDSMSYSDWRLSGCLPGEPDDDLYNVAAHVADLFMGDLWPVLVDISRTLIVGAGSVHSFQTEAVEAA
ncbi:MAG: hypothetical protein WC048_18065 [Rhizobium sp.]